MVDPEPILETQEVRQEYTINMTPVHCVANPPTSECFWKVDAYWRIWKKPKWTQGHTLIYQNQTREPGTVRWSHDSLHQHAAQTLVRYLEFV